MGLLTYTTQEVQDRLDTVGSMVRPNLLDNWYFEGGNEFPVNQRGASSYTGSTYTIDRWRMWNASMTVTLTASGIVLKNTDSGSKQQFVQYFTSEETSAFSGKTATFSMLSDGQVYSTTGKLGSLFSYNTGQVTLQVNTGNGGLLAAQLFVNQSITTSAIQAVKLELGDSQTLAHWDEATQTWVLNEVPNYTEELEKCQRFAVKIGSPTIFRAQANYVSSGAIRFTVPVPVPMRTAPTVGTYTTLNVYSAGTQSGFTFTTENNGNSLTMVATKTSHGLSTAMLQADNLLLSADL